MSWSSKALVRFLVVALFVSSIVADSPQWHSALRRASGKEDHDQVSAATFYRAPPRRRSLAKGISPDEGPSSNEPTGMSNKGHAPSHGKGSKWKQSERHASGSSSKSGSPPSSKGGQGAHGSDPWTGGPTASPMAKSGSPKSIVSCSSSKAGSSEGSKGSSMPSHPLSASNGCPKGSSSRPSPPSSPVAGTDLLMKGETDDSSSSPEVDDNGQLSPSNEGDDVATGKLSPSNEDDGTRLAGDDSGTVVPDPRFDGLGGIMTNPPKPRVEDLDVADSEKGSEPTNEDYKSQKEG